MDYPATQPRIAFPNLREATPTQAKKIVDGFLASLQVDDPIGYINSHSTSFAKIISNLQVMAGGGMPSDTVPLDRAQSSINHMLDTDAEGQALAEKLHTAILMGMPPEKKFGRDPSNDRGSSGVF